MKILSYIRVGRKEQLESQEEKLKQYWSKRIGAWRKC